MRNHCSLRTQECTELNLIPEATNVFHFKKHRHATHARVFFLGGGGHCGSNEILCFVEKRN